MTRPARIAARLVTELTAQGYTRRAALAEARRVVYVVAPAVRGRSARAALAQLGGAR